MANTNINAEDKFVLGGHEFSSRFILGSGKYNLELVEAAVNEAKAEIITLALRRANSNGEGNILDYISNVLQYYILAKTFSRRFFE